MPTTQITQNEPDFNSDYLNALADASAEEILRDGADQKQMAEAIAIHPPLLRRFLGIALRRHEHQREIESETEPDFSGYDPGDLTDIPDLATCEAMLAEAEEQERLAHLLDSR